MNAPRFEVVGDDVVIRIPIEKAHAVRVAASPCPCHEAKSNGTNTIRKWISDGLARALGETK